LKNIVPIGFMVGGPSRLAPDNRHRNPLHISCLLDTLAILFRNIVRLCAATGFALVYGVFAPGAHGRHGGIGPGPASRGSAEYRPCCSTGKCSSGAKWTGSDASAYGPFSTEQQCGRSACGCTSYNDRGYAFPCRIEEVTKRRRKGTVRKLPAPG